MQLIPIPDRIESSPTPGRGNPILETASRQIQIDSGNGINRGSQGFRLLTPGNPKTKKGRGLGYWTFILHLAPAELSGFNVCPMATAGCKRACLNTAGRGGISRGGILTYRDVARGIRNEIQVARRMRTRAFFEHRGEFMALLAFEIAKASKRARSQGYTPVFRLNGTSEPLGERAGGRLSQYHNHVQRRAVL
jgi:hypothetical protein